MERQKEMGGGREREREMRTRDGNKKAMTIDKRGLERK